MKFIQFTAIIVFLCQNSLFAQEFGFKGGLNFATYKVKSEVKPDLTNVAGPMFGVFWIIEGSEHLKFNPEIIYSSKGTKSKASGGGFTSSGTDRIGYLEIPLNLGYHIPFGEAELILTAGPYLGIGIGGSWEAKISDGTTTESFDGNVVFTTIINEDNIDDFDDDDGILNRFDLGFNIGPRLRINNVLFEATYGIGVIDIFPRVDLPGFESDSDEAFNRCFRLGLSFVIRN